MEAGQAVRYAGFWIRGCAIFIDGLLYYATEVLVQLAMGEGWREAAGFADSYPKVGEWSADDWSVFVTIELISMTYFTVMVARYGGTLGKLALRLQVVNVNGQPMSYAGAFRRNLALYLSGLAFVVPLPDAIMLCLLPCLAGFVMAAFDSQKRALHDRICGTRVIRQKKKENVGD